ncbi:MAG: UDP-N-acetylmuramoyl-L-alanine--D-glutamate ligase [Bacillota bacterium]
MYLKNKKVSVLGFSSRTGISLVKFLNNKGAEIIISDTKSRGKLDNLIKEINEFNCEFDLGGHSKKVLESDLIVLSPGVPLDIPILKKAELLNIEIISEVELAYQFCRAKIIAVTGTNGKTTTTDLLGKMLQGMDNRTVKTAGNIGIPFISVVEDLNENDIAVVEVSSFQLEGIKKFKPWISMYLNYSPDHLDRHVSEESYKNAKFKIFSNQTEKDYAVIDIDDPYLNSIKNDINARTLYLSENNSDADLFIDNQKLLMKRDSKLIEILDYQYMNLPGDHNKKNAAFAAAAAYLCGQSTEVIKHILENYHLKEHRMEFIENDYNYIIVDDSKATNPAAAVKAVESFKQPVILIAGGQDRKADFGEFVDTVAKNVKFLILLGETADKIYDLIDRQTSVDAVKVSNMHEAVKTAFEKIEVGDCLLLSPGCPSWDMYESYKIRGNLFKEEVKNMLNY